MSVNPKHEWFKLTKGSIVFLFIYYSMLLSLSVGLAIYEFIFFKSYTRWDIFSASLGISIIYSLLGATVFYVRKLYKACVNLDIVKPVDSNDNIRQIGVLAYFVLRPLFAGVFSIVILVILKSGISILSTSETLTVQFYYLSIIISFFTGFSAGDVVDKFETLGKEIVEKVSNLKF